MKIYLTKDVPYSITNQINKLFPNMVLDAKANHVKIEGTSLKEFLISSKLLDEQECILSYDFKFTTAVNKIVVNNTVLAVIVKFTVWNSIDIDFIFKPNEIEIVFKDCLYWKSFYFHSKKNLQDNGVIYEDINADIIPYMLYGKYITEMDWAVDDNLIELYRKGERNFKNLLVLSDMVNI